MFLQLFRRAVAIFLIAHAAFERAQHANFSFHGHACRMRHIDHAAASLPEVRR